MDDVALEAMSQLHQAMASLLPPASDDAMASSLLVTPLRVAPTGIGGFVGVHHEPEGEVVGRRISARVDVTVRAAGDRALDDAVALATRSVLARSRGDLSGLGILKVQLGSLGPVARPPDDAGHSVRDVVFDVEFEHLHRPSDDGGVIESVPLDISVTASAPGRLLRRGPFHTPDALAAFEVVDDPGARLDAPSSWAYDDGAIRQRTRVRGGHARPTLHQPGTYLLLRDTPTQPPVADFTMTTRFRSTSEGGVGVVFRYRDPEHCCYVLLSSTPAYRMIGCVVDGEFRSLGGGTVDAEPGFEVDRLYTLRLVVQGRTSSVLLDGEEVLRNADATPVGPGRVGLMTRACDGARFYDLTLQEL